MTLIYFILILGIVVFIHELGHFLFAKKAGIYVYEFSLGMGPRLFKFNRKRKVKGKDGKVTYEPDETDYCIRLLPIGGYVQMAGEEVEADESIPADRRLQSKPWLSRFMTMVAGVMFNFLLAIVLLFFIGLINGVTLDSTKLVNIDSSIYPTLKEGDRIVKIGGKMVNNYDKLALELTVQGNKKFDMEVKHANGNKEIVPVEPKEVLDENGELLGYDYSFQVDGDDYHSLWGAIRYAFGKFFSMIEQMFFTILYLCTGTLSIKMLSGPVGIFSVVGQAASGTAPFLSLVSLLALISVNVGFINLLPFPAFDGCHALFLIIEKIKGSPVSPKIENTIHNIGFLLLMLLMIYITYNDILRLF